MLPIHEPDVVPHPIDEHDRVASLDVLRGVAVLGILLMNIQSFAGIEAAYLNPTAYGDLTEWNYATWLGCHLLAFEKFLTIFTMLFGAGVVVLGERLEASGRSPAGVHYRRMAWLALFGLIHAFGLWHGDVLFHYAVCGAIVFLVRRFQPIWLVMIAAPLIAGPSVLSLGVGLISSMVPAADFAELREGWFPSPDAIARELATYRGGWTQQLPARARAAIELQSILLFMYSWRTMGLMLVGMALFRLNVLSAQLARSVYAAMAIGGFAVGVPIVWNGVRLLESHEWEGVYSIFVGSQWNYWGSLLVAGGWVSLIMWWCRNGRPSWPRRCLARTGQMALTNYLAQTVICTTLFYGHGLGWYGRVERTEQLGIVVLIWIVQLAFSNLWLARYRFGPMEWVWRSLTYRALQPLRRR